VAVGHTESAGHLAALVSSSDDAIISKDLNGTILSWNAAAERMFGYTGDEAIGQHITLIIPSDRTAEEDFVLGRIRAGLRVEHYETVRRRKDGSTLEVSLSVSPIHNAHGVIVGASKIARDITEQKYHQRVAEEASRAKDQFLAALSHELRTPLNTILGYIQMQQNRSVTPDLHAKALDVMERNARSLARLVDDVLDTSRIVTGKMRLDLRPTELGPIVQQAVESIRPGVENKGLTLATEIEPDLTAQADADRMNQVLWNLLSNALKFTPAGGAITVTARRDGRLIRIAVTDTGVGLTQAEIPLIFQRFWQGEGDARGHGGLGLGLALARHFVELHGGRMTAISPGPARGSTFEIELPAR
jgi:PAS domain S-box-containing protein